MKKITTPILRVAFLMALTILFIPLSLTAQERPVLVKDINPTGDGFPTNMTAFNDKIYFNGFDGIHGNRTLGF